MPNSSAVAAGIVGPFASLDVPWLPRRARGRPPAIIHS